LEKSGKRVKKKRKCQDKRPGSEPETSGNQQKTRRARCKKARVRGEEVRERRKEGVKGPEDSFLDKKRNMSLSR